MIELVDQRVNRENITLVGLLDPMSDFLLVNNREAYLHCPRPSHKCYRYPLPTATVRSTLRHARAVDTWLALHISDALQ